MNTSKKRYDIISGPSKDALFDACKNAYSNLDKTSLNIVIKDAYEPLSVKDITISSITHEDGSGESFNLRGYCTANLSPDGANKKRFEAYYNTATQKGHIYFG